MVLFFFRQKKNLVLQIYLRHCTHTPCPLFLVFLSLFWTLTHKNKKKILKRMAEKKKKKKISGGTNYFLFLPNSIWIYISRNWVLLNTPKYVKKKNSKLTFNNSLFSFIYQSTTIPSKHKYNLKVLSLGMELGGGQKAPPPPTSS